MQTENLVFTFLDYQGSCQFDSESKTYRGKILGLRDLVTYEASNTDDLRQEFIESVKDYLETCSELNREPSKDN
jgi:predicted HicB family RNase H-like nuclease